MMPVEGFDALGNAREQRHQGRLEGIRQNVGAVVTARPQLPADSQAFAERQFAVRERACNGLAHLGHAPVDRQRPTRPEHIDRRLGVAPLEQREQGMRQQRIPDPRRRNDQDPGHGLLDTPLTAKARIPYVHGTSEYSFRRKGNAKEGKNILVNKSRIRSQ